MTGTKVQLMRARDGFHVPYMSEGDSEDALVLLLGRRALSRIAAAGEEVTGYYENLALFNELTDEPEFWEDAEQIAFGTRLVVLGVIPAPTTAADFGPASIAHEVAKLSRMLIPGRPVLVGLEDTAVIALLGAATYPDVFAGAAAVSLDPAGQGALDSALAGMEPPTFVVTAGDCVVGRPFLCEPALLAAFAASVRAVPTVPEEGRFHRALRTVLFTDIVDSTRHAATVGDVQWSRQLAGHHVLARKVVERSGGRLIDFAGDGMLAIFDRPEPAVRAALDMVAEVGSTLDMQIRAGLHAGIVELCDGNVTGIAVHLAARVQAAAGPDEVLVSASLPPIIDRDSFSFADRGEHRLKGIEEGVRLLEVLRP
ncbi:MAG TPA: adenylate/guanylate cyclase domain-containing protein [Acidimicrobiales bacterium]|nr:adenylate/guanylate cyclase domain-containing protein [Acidimicrobiales bacterium]